ncbi:MAG: T9SS type A sorting domain-containing protein [Saprospiraceae bacterium]|nr:T9SS type A sorting domain-containing protein [Saprospiraceae bacterium]
MRLSPDGCLNDACDHLQKYWHFPEPIVATTDLEINRLSIYPNPGSDFIQVTIDEQMQFPIRYELLDLSGQRIEIGTLATQDHFSIEAGWLHEGIYILRIMDKAGKVW